MMYLRRGMQEPRLMPPTPNGTKDIDSFTNTTVSQRFVIYGQRHITGVDVEQPKHGRAIATLSKGNTMRDLLQGVFRMRKILLDQRVDFLLSRQYSTTIREELPKMIAEPLDFEDGVKIEHLMLMALFYRFEKEMCENELIPFQKIDAALKSNLIRGNLSSNSETFDAIYDLSTFVRKPKNEFYQQITTSKNTGCFGQTLLDYADRLNTPMLSLKMVESSLFIDESRSIIESCPIKDLEFDFCGGLTKFDKNTTFESENMVELEQQEEMTLENMNQIETKIPNAHKVDDLSLAQVINLEEPALLPLGGLIEEVGGRDSGEFFSKNIYATRGFYQTIETEDGTPNINISDKYKKNPFLVLMFKGRDGKLKTAIMPPIDREEYLSWSIEEIIEAGAVFFTSSGVPVLFKIFFEFIDDPSLENYSEIYAKYMENVVHLLEDNDMEGHGHLSQILLLNGNFDMLCRYFKMYNALIKLIIEKHGDYVRFINFMNTYIPEVKKKDFFGTEFYQLWKMNEEDVSQCKCLLG